MALILLGGIVVISTIVFFVHSKEGRSTPSSCSSNRAEAAAIWTQLRRESPPTTPEVLRRRPATRPLGRSTGTTTDTRLRGAAGLTDRCRHRRCRRRLLDRRQLWRRRVVVAVDDAAAALRAPPAAPADRQVARGSCSRPWCSPVRHGVALGFGAITATARGTWDQRTHRRRAKEDSFGTRLRSWATRPGAWSPCRDHRLCHRDAGAKHRRVPRCRIRVLRGGRERGPVRADAVRHRAFMLSTNAVASSSQAGYPCRASGSYEPVPTMVELTNLRALLTFMIYTALLAVPAAWSFTRRDVELTSTRQTVPMAPRSR